MRHILIRYGFFTGEVMVCLIVNGKALPKEEILTESLREMQKETDEFTHRENVKVYRNVQAVVVEEVKKQTEELKEANRGLKPMLIITLAVTLANAALFILQILGILGV